MALYFRGANKILLIGTAVNDTKTPNHSLSLEREGVPFTLRDIVVCLEEEKGMCQGCCLLICLDILMEASVHFYQTKNNIKT